MLTAEQIESLDQLCREKGVQFYDLRLEIVDHLATEIEQELQKHPGTDFPALVRKVLGAFGKTGFRSIVEAKEASVQKEYDRCHRRYFRSFFTLPKVLLTALIAVCLYLPFTFIEKKELLQIQQIYLLMIAFICFLTIAGILYQHGPHNRQLLLLKGVKRRSLNRNFGLLCALLPYGLNVMRADPPAFFSTSITLHASVLVFAAVSYSFTFIARYHAVLKMYAKAKRDYPLAFMKKIS